MSPTTHINGSPVVPPSDASLVECEPGVYSILHAGTSFEVYVTENCIEVDGHPLSYEIKDPRQWTRSAGLAGVMGKATIIAPMPGKVVRILTAAGDVVTAGQGIVVVEAMKMQNELKSPIDGVVVKIAVAENDGVAAGAVLAVIEVAG
jgi:biotin carboxyl carrier protein